MKKIAIVYDWIDKWGGVERVLLTLHKMFPEAILYTSYFDKDSASWAKDLNIKTSFLQKLPNFIKKSRILSFIFYPFVFESFDFSNYDLVISVTSSLAKSIITKPKTKHICYLLTPTRYFWSHKGDYLKNNFINYFMGGYLDYIKKFDWIAAQRPDKIISISETVKQRCKKYYQRESKVIYPGFDEEYWSNIKSKIKNLTLIETSVDKQKYFLVVSRLEPYKKVDLVVQSFNRLKHKLIIVGEGSEERKLKQIAGKNITFLSKLSDAMLGNLYFNAQALVMMQEEDYGYVALEAQFFDCPVIAYKKGGARETVEDNKTGIFFNNQNEQSLQRAIARFSKIKYNLKSQVKKFAIVNIKRFSNKKFIEKFIRDL
jgi:glycosyltransferase involved in cell wall biosynthesis